MLKNYLKIAYKVLLRQKFFTFVSLFGITITLTILFVVVAMTDTILYPGGRDSKLSRSLLVDEIVLMGENLSISSHPSYYMLNRYVRSMKTPTTISLQSATRSTAVYVGGRKLDLDIKYADAEFWDIMDFEFVEGGPYRKDDVEAASAVAVISERVRDEVFGTGSVIGETLESTSGNFRIMGVVPQRELPGEIVAADLWVPATLDQSEVAGTRAYGEYSAILLPAQDDDQDAIKREFGQQLDQVRTDFSGDYDSVACVIATPLELAVSHSGFLGTESVTMNIAAAIFMMVLFMLLPAMNLVNMNISRIFERSSEIGVRKAFGAAVSTLVWQFIVENVVLTMVGGALAIVLALAVLNVLNDSGMVPFAHFALNIRVLVYSLILSVFFGVFSGVLPAYRMSRLHPVEALRGVTA